MELLRNFSLYKRPIVREFLAELLATFLLMTFGIGSCAQSTLSGKTVGTPVSASMSWGLGAAVAVSASYGVTGGHLNPAVSLAMAIIGRLSWVKLPVYMCAQYLGSFIASVVCYFVYLDALNNFDGGVRQVTGDLATASIWSTYPQTYVSIWTGFGDQILGTSLLVTGAMALTDGNHRGSKVSHLNPFFVCGLVVVLGFAFSLNCGCALNPARDLSPRFFTAIAGWGLEPFSFRNYTWFWVPIAGPHVGAILGAFIYQFAVGLHWPPDEDVTQNESPDKDRKTGGVVNDAIDLQEHFDISVTAKGITLSAHM